MTLFICLLGAALAADPPKVEYIGHRGASHDAPENTVASFKLAYEQGADAAELDVWISKDGRVMVIHDGDTKRVASVDKKVSEQAFNELRALDVGKAKGAAFAGEKIPTLEEALATVPSGRRMFVEIKCGVAGVPAILKVIQESGLRPEQVAVIGFSAQNIAAVKKARPDLKAYWLVGLGAAKGKEPPKAEALIAKAKDIAADGLDVSDSPVIDKTFVEKVKAAGLGLYVWTVNSPDAAKRLRDLGVDGITSDRAAWLKQQLK